MGHRLFLQGYLSKGGIEHLDEIIYEGIYLLLFSDIFQPILLQKIVMSKKVPTHGMSAMHYVTVKY